MHSNKKDFKIRQELKIDYKIEIPFDAPNENCLVIELIKEGLENVSGTVIYNKAFFE